MTTTASAPPPVDLSFLLNQTSYALSAKLSGALAGLGITVRDYCVLMKAAETERTQNVIAELAGLDKTTMVVTLDGLEHAGLAERRVSSSDRRARVIGVTARGRKVLGRAYAVVAAVYDEVLDPLPRLSARCPCRRPRGPGRRGAGVPVPRAATCRSAKPSSASLRLMLPT